LAGKTMRTPLGSACAAAIVAESIEIYFGQGRAVRAQFGPKAAEALFLAAIGGAMEVVLGFGLGWVAVLISVRLRWAASPLWYLYIRQGLCSLIGHARPCSWA
jgi:hypothetical protein